MHGSLPGLRHKTTPAPRRAVEGAEGLFNFFGRADKAPDLQRSILAHHLVPQMDRPVAAIFVHRPFIVLFHVVLNDLQLLFPNIGAQGQSAGVASVMGDIARFQIEQQPRKSRHRPDREGDHLAVRDGTVFQVDRVPGAVVQPRSMYAQNT